jgi:hypothetical protein
MGNSISNPWECHGCGSTYMYMLNDHPFGKAFPYVEHNALMPVNRAVMFVVIASYIDMA